MSIFLVFLAAAGVLIAAFFIVNRPQYVGLEAKPPDDFPPDGFSHESFELLLERYVDGRGNVGYAEWHVSSADREALDRYLGAVAAYSPDTTPKRFPARSEQLAYWIYAYNAWVIRTVLGHWPIGSVTDLKAPIEAVKGLGFFYRLRFPFGGESLSLYAVEHDKILKGFQDPRIHFVLNCASDSCPPMRPQLPTGSGLETLLDDKAAEFVNDEKNVLIDHPQRTVRLSSIFKWYRKDFVNDLRRRGYPANAGLLDYIGLYLADPDEASLATAREYDIVFTDYDWSLNQAGEQQD